MTFKEKLYNKIYKEADKVCCHNINRDRTSFKLGSYFLTGLFVELYLQVKTLNEALEGHVGQDYKDSKVGRATYHLIDYVEEFVNDDPRPN